MKPSWRFFLVATVVVVQAAIGGYITHELLQQNGDLPNDRFLALLGLVGIVVNTMRSTIKDLIDRDID